MKSAFGKRYLNYYFAAWATIIVPHFFIFRFAFKMDSEESLADSLVFNGIFALMGIGIASMMRFSDLSKRAPIEQIIYHLTGASVMILVWVSASHAILKLLRASSPEYLIFLRETVTVRVISGVLLYVALIVVHYLLIKMAELREQRGKEEELRGLLRETELNSLRSQIRPHFLFNSLNSISSLTLTSPEKARSMVIKLAEFMRYSLNIADQPMSTVEKELYHTQLYLDIEKVRFGHRLNLSSVIDERTLHHDMPSMTLQPLMENAVKYGVYDATEPVTIDLSVRQAGGRVIVEMANPIQEATSDHGTGTGLKNIRARLVNIYRRTDLLETWVKDDHFHATLTLPDHE